MQAKGNQQHAIDIMLLCSLDALLVPVGHMLLLKVDCRLEEVSHALRAVCNLLALGG
jgi:hypothetical protein